MRKNYEEKYTSAGNLDNFGANEHEKMHILSLKIQKYLIIKDIK